MKSRISLCNGTILKKDMTRFAPLMIVTGLVLWVIGMTVNVAIEEMTRGGYTDRPEVATVALALLGFLALLSAVNFFTYLTKKGECDAIHALPLRRETLLFTKIIAAFLQFAIPFGVFFACFPGDRGWLFQMGVSGCAWLFFFGLAALSMMLSGRRLAGFILYSLILDLGNSISLIWENLYLPLLPGVYLSGNPMDYSPMTIMTMLDLEEGTLAEIFLPMLGFALLGVVFLVLTWVAYRKRKLERAGDFLTVKWLEPVLAWGLGITVSIFTTTIAQLLDGSIWVGLGIGLTIGYFAARMFFARSIKVFGKKNLIGWAALVAVMAASLFITSLDPLGVVNRVPDAEDIESVCLYDNNYYLLADYDVDFSGNSYCADDPAEIDAMRTMHQELLLTNDQEAEGVQQYHNRFYLVYNLKNGTTVSRTYFILGGDALKQIKYVMSQPEGLLGSADLEELLASISELRANGVNGGIIHTERAFLEVFLEECKAGWMYTPDPNGQSSWDIRFYSDELGYRTVDVPLTAQKTIAWLENYFKNTN